MSVLGLALIGMVCWGVGPIFAKLGLGTMDPVTGLGIRTLAAGVMVSGWLAAAPRTPRFYVVSLKGLLLIVLEAALATVVGDLAYYAALKRGQCAETSIILSASPAVTVFLSAIVLGERPTTWSLAGAVLIATGLALVGLQPRP